MSLKARLIQVLCAAVLGSLLFGGTASASYPGQKGPILFVGKFADDQLWRVNEDGSGLALVADFGSTSPDYFAFIASPSVSQDGKRIALVYIQQAIAPGTPLLCGVASRCVSIVVMNGDGSNRRVIFSRSADTFVSAGAWLSADGHRVAFTLFAQNHGNGLFVINSDGTGLRLVTSSFHLQFDLPKWSPDGQTLAFTTLNPDPCCFGTHSIYLVDVTGANLRPLLLAAGGNDLEPDWSPDGAEIAFVRAFPYPDYRIFAAAADGAPEREIVGNQRVAESPTWAPDGSELAFSEFQGQDIAVVNRDGTNVRVIPGVAGSQPVWAPLSLG